MPQADMFYSADLPLDPRAILAEIEMVIAAHDTSSGACKGRAHPVAVTHHTHVLIRIRMLDKPHRDDAFMQALLTKLQAAVCPRVPPCTLGFELGFIERNYLSVIHS